MRNIMISLMSILLIQGCSSAPKINNVVIEKDQILSTAGDKTMPDWAEKGELQPVRFDDGKVYSVGITTLKGTDRVEAGSRIAENNARSNFSKTITNRMQFIFQQAEENTDFTSQTQHIGSEVSSLTSHSMIVEGQWWKRYAQSDESGSRHIFYKIYSLVTMPEIELKKAISAAVNHVDDKQLSQAFKAKVDKQWNSFVEGERTPATDKE